MTSDAIPPPIPVSLIRTSRGWSVSSPAGEDVAADLIEGLSLADLIAEELGVLVEPDRTARRSARGASRGGGRPPGEAADPVEARLAALERTVAQLEHALAARVSTERAIGVLAERHGISARSAFESLRGDARSQGRPVAQLAREVLDGLGTDAPTGTPAPTDHLPSGQQSVSAPSQRRTHAVDDSVTARLPRELAGAPFVGTPSAAATDGRS